MGASNSKVDAASTQSRRDDFPAADPPFNEKFNGILKYDKLQTNYDGSSAVFYKGADELSLFAPYVRSHANSKFLVESFSECPPGKCSGGNCTRLQTCEERCDNLISYLRKNGCVNNVFDKKAWGCTNREIGSRNLFRVVPVIDSRPAPAPVHIAPLAPVPVVEKPVVVKPPEKPTPPIKPNPVNEIPLDAATPSSPAVQPAAVPEPVPEPPEPIPDSVAAEPAKKSSKFAAIGRSVRSVVGAKKAQLKENIKELLAAQEIQFVKNEDALTEEGRQIVDQVAAFLRDHPEISMSIESHTNCFAGKCDNGCYLMELSQARVDKVREELIAAGCRNAFKTKGWGCKHPQIGNTRLVRIFPDDEDDDDDDN